MFIQPNETQYLVTGLDFGTSYHAYIEAFFDQNIAGQNTNALESWILIAKTKGVGPDSRTLHASCQLTTRLFVISGPLCCNWYSCANKRYFCAKN